MIFLDYQTNELNHNDYEKNSMFKCMPKYLEKKKKKRNVHI